jgi:hypothetical protein
VAKKLNHAQLTRDVAQASPGSPLVDEITVENGIFSVIMLPKTDSEEEQRNVKKI